VEIVDSVLDLEAEAGEDRALEIGNEILLAR
jgi:hypothetical protein